ncbi:MAG: aminotransferase class V-fold PLP-dependent enzyme, partial [Maritimibacter sp.]
MTTAAAQLDQFDRFKASLDRADLIENLRDGMIGEGIEVPGPNGSHPLIYADYVASGRALEYDVIFTGSGATAGLNRLVGLLGVDAGGQGAQTPLVLIGPYEHHSNILPWRESGAQIIEIPEAATGGPDMGTLEAVLTEHKGRRIVGAFSAMSNVTGIVTDVKQVTRLLKAHGAISVWDYAGGAPYLPIDVAGDAEARIDAVALSPHKFIGGPGASGVLILRRDAVARAKPTLPGGGTVRFVSPWAHDYSGDVVAREEAGTPNVVGDLRAALCFIVKEAIGQDYMTRRLEELRQRAEAAWADIPGLHILGLEHQDRIPIFSFIVTAPDDERIHQQLVTRMLSDLHGV